MNKNQILYDIDENEYIFELVSLKEIPDEDDLVEYGKSSIQLFKNFENIFEGQFWVFKRGKGKSGLYIYKNRINGKIYYYFYPEYKKIYNILSKKNKKDMASFYNFTLFFNKKYIENPKVIEAYKNYYGYTLLCDDGKLYEVRYNVFNDLQYEISLNYKDVRNINGKDLIECFPNNKNQEDLLNGVKILKVFNQLESYNNEKERRRKNEEIAKIAAEKKAEELKIKEMEDRIRADIEKEIKAKEKPQESSDWRDKSTTKRSNVNIDDGMPWWSMFKEKEKNWEWDQPDSICGGYKDED